MHDIALLVLDDCDAASVLGPMDVFGAANSLWRRQIGNTPDPLFRLTLVSADGNPVTSAAGVGLEPRHALADMPRVDALIVATPHFHSPRSLFRLAASLTPALAPIADLEQRGTVVTAACTATALLAETGLFNGRDATTSWWLAGAFRKRYPQVRLQPDRVLVEDGRFVTAGAGMAWQNLALHLLARFAGTDMAGLCARSLLIDTTRDSQAPYAHFGASETNRDPLVLKAQHWMPGAHQKTIPAGRSRRRAGRQQPHTDPALQAGRRRNAQRLCPGAAPGTGKAPTQRDPSGAGRHRGTGGLWRFQYIAASAATRYRAFARPIPQTTTAGRTAHATFGPGALTRSSYC